MVHLSMSRRESETCYPDAHNLRSHPELGAFPGLQIDMPAPDLQSGLTTLHLGRVVHYVETCTSTRDLAPLLLADQDLPHGAVIVAGRQTAGRGTPGKTFASDTPEGLWCTLVIDRPTPEPITLLASVAVCRCLRSFGLLPHVKWPNDVLIDGLKISGCLSEPAQRPSGAPVHLLSIGLNIQQATFAQTPLDGIAVSVRMLLGEGCPGIPRIFCRLMSMLEDLIVTCHDVRAEWLACTAMLGRWYRLVRPGSTILIVPVDLSTEGHLIVQDAQGTRHRLAGSGDLDLRPHPRQEPPASR
ncbi:MAG: biotin--[acetyl-CoA-carboxylase] ligase [Phycisphaeraceae bacterium]|nr:biotin--[acetyl-CoA-carboxylase] ligase [Phycisphaeraceae bacterium]MCW5755320.1 biotin--[acetyl-CoA-carboxylase] ligase [Phycisphaeraceae bacterium]